MSFHIPPDVLLTLMRPESTFDERKDAAIELAVQAYQRGRDDAFGEIESQLSEHGFTMSEIAVGPKAPAVRLS